MTSRKPASRVIIIGANFAGLSAASKLSKCHEVSVIDSREEFQWTPNIHEILSDVKKETNLSLDLRTIITKLGHTFIKQTVLSVNAEAQTVTLNNEQTLSYDVLLIASGHTRSNYGIKGANKFAYGFRTAKDVIQIHNEIEDAVNALDVNDDTSGLNINIVGGGFTGVEVLGELLRKYAGNKHLHFNVIDTAERLVQGLPEKLSSDIIKQCKDHNVSFHFNQQISEVKEQSIHFSNGNSIPSDITIWTAGTTLPAYTNSINSRSAANGLVVNPYLQSQDYQNIFVAGDSATTPKSAAKQASNAMDMGAHAASNINRFCAQKTLYAFKVSSKPVLLSFGDINTYFVQGPLVLASPLLAATKEAVYQFYMARLSIHLPLEENVIGIASRITLSAEKLLLAEVIKLRPTVLLGRSKLL